MPNPTGINQYTKGGGGGGDEKAARLRAAKSARAKARREAKKTGTPTSLTTMRRNSNSNTNAPAAASGKPIISSRTAQKRLVSAGQKVAEKPSKIGMEGIRRALAAKSAADNRTNEALAKAHARKQTPEHQAKVERAQRIKKAAKYFKTTPKEMVLKQRRAMSKPYDPRRGNPYA